MKRPGLQNMRVGVSRIAFRGRKVFGTFEERAPGSQSFHQRDTKLSLETKQSQSFLMN